MNATSCLMAAALAALVGVAHAAPETDALRRPALATSLGARSLLLGAAQAGARLVAVGERGIIVLSDDGGRSWHQAAVPTSVTLTAVRFVGIHGFAVGHGGVVLTSDDAGSSWTLRLDGRRAAALALQAAQGSADPAVSKIARQLVSDGPDKPFLDVLAFDARHAVAVGAYGLAFETGDGGRTWTSWMSRLDNPKGLHLYALRARGDEIVIAGEQGLLLRSVDGGHSFVRIQTPYKGSFFTLELPAEHDIVVAGLRGNVLSSTDAGQSWTPWSSPMAASITGSALRDDGTLMMVNQAGAVLLAHDGILQPLPLPGGVQALPPLTAVMARADGSLLTLGVQGAIGLPAPAAGVAR